MFWLLHQWTGWSEKKTSESLKRLALWNCLSKSNSKGCDPSTFACDFDGSFLRIPGTGGPLMNSASQTPPPLKTWFSRSRKRFGNGVFPVRYGVGCFRIGIGIVCWLQYIESKQSQWSATQTLHKVAPRRLSQGWPSSVATNTQTICCDYRSIFFLRMKRYSRRPHFLHTGQTLKLSALHITLSL